MAEASGCCGNNPASDSGGFMDPLRQIFFGNQGKYDVINTSSDKESERTSKDKQNGDVVCIKDRKENKDLTSNSLSSADYSHPYPYR